MKTTKRKSNKSENSVSSNSDESISSPTCIYYGPIRYYRRRGKAPTLLTGRKSKFEELDGEQLAQREIRRQKNRILSRKLKEKREFIHNQLLQQMKQLEQKHIYLLNYIEKLEAHKKSLLYQLEHSKQDPLMNLINQNQLRLFFEENDHSSFDTINFISPLDDQQSSFDYLQYYKPQ